MGESRRRAETMRAMRAMRASATAPATPPPPASLAESCDLCGNDLSDDHRHMLHLGERYILCTCETCLAMKAGDADLRPTGSRTLWLEDFDLPDEVWAAFQIPVGLAFFLRSSGVGRMAAMYPSPAGATECELQFADWERLVTLNPILEDLEADIEALIVNRMTEPHEHVVAPIDEAYKLVGMIKANWEGISGGDALAKAVPAFFGQLREKAPS